MPYPAAALLNVTPASVGLGPIEPGDGRRGKQHRIAGQPADARGGQRSAGEGVQPVATRGPRARQYPLGVGVPLGLRRERDRGRGDLAAAGGLDDSGAAGIGRRVKPGAAEQARPGEERPGNWRLRGEGLSELVQGRGQNCCAAPPVSLGDPGEMLMLE